MHYYHAVKKCSLQVFERLFISRHSILWSELAEGAGPLQSKEAFGLPLLSCSQCMERFGIRRTIRNKVLIIKDITEKTLIC